MNIPTYISKNWGWFLIYGIILILLGLVAISAAVFTTIASIIFLGSILMIGGIIALITTLTSWRHKTSAFILHLIMSVLYLIAGISLILHPIIGAESLTLLLAVFYIILGIFRILSSIIIRLPDWGWRLLSGLIALLLGIIIMAYWPAASLFIIGLFIGIELLFNGWTYIILSISAKSAARA